MVPDSSGEGADEEPFEVAAELVRRLHEADIRYGVYKNIGCLRPALAGRHDLDLIVASADLGRFRAILVELHALRGLCNRFSSDAGPGREDWFVPDFSRADYLHLDVRTEVFAGPKFAKNHPVLRYEDVREWQTAASPFPPIRLVSPEEAARIAVLSSAADRYLGSGEAWIRRLTFFGARKFTGFSPALSAAKRRIEPGGAIFALIGPDGVGKSSQAQRVASLFQRKFRCTAVYLGSGEGGWELRRFVKRWYHSRKGLHRDRSGTSNSQRAPNQDGATGSLTKALSGLAAALERYVTLTLARMLLYLGAIVISDRWPQNLQPGFFDGPSRAVPNGSALIRFLASIERALYRRMARHEPDLAIHMLIDFETSRARKPGDRDPADFEQRLSLMREMRARNPNVRLVDARESFDEVTRELFRWCWLALWVRSGGTAALAGQCDVRTTADAAESTDDGRTLREPERMN